MKDNFRGWKSVYAFTFRQATKGAGFKLVTALISILIIIALILINVTAAKPDKSSNQEPSPIKRVYVLDNSGLKPADYKTVMTQLPQGKQFEQIDFALVTGQTRDALIKNAAAASSETIAAIITSKDSAYELEAVIPWGSKITKDQAEALLSQMTSVFQTNKLMQAGLSETQLKSVLKPSVTSFAEIGKSSNQTAQLVKILAPMLFGFILYMMLLLYGQTMSKSVSTEKTSKLMETLLTSIHPYALITGKVLAITSMALLQFITWIAAAYGGIYAGNAVAHSIYPHYQSTAVIIINFLKNNIGETAMTIPAVVLAIIFFCVGFLFYCVLAALAGCLVSKPEDVASTQALFVFPVIISWLVSYFASFMDNDALQTAVRYIPFTAPFSVPVELITGSIGLFEGLIALVLLLVFSFFTIILSARIYKGLLLYTGQKLSFKMIGGILRTNK
ncbi:MAG: ABC transporter permease [Bacillota bacterium]|nr:ABC transporter permease [Bacillota bacterium]